MKIFTAPRYLTVFLLAAVLSVLAFGRFHGVILGFRSEIARDWKAAGGRDTGGYIVSVAEQGGKEAPPRLPDLSSFTVQSIVARAPSFRRGRVAFAKMDEIPDLREYVKNNGRVQNMRLMQMDVDPRVVVIRDGDYDLPHLYDDMAVLSGGLLRRDGGIYMLRFPLMIAPGASLTVDGVELRLSREQGAFITNSGSLFILKTKITGWSEKENAPAPFVGKRAFRPFINTWSGARLYAAGSRFSNLGYLRGKSYGMSFSTCRYCLEAAPGLPPPTGVLVANVFSGLYYGFYSYEAENVAIVGNTYIDNVVYGIDPHDRSHGLIIADNDVGGTLEKHGIIISRAVNDNWIFGNRVQNNHGSGIMLDRSCTGNIVAENTSSRNGGDGITFFESPGNATFNNTVFGNALSGIRIRNSTGIKLSGDRISDNGEAPVALYSAVLENHALDPYDRSSAAEASGLVLRAPGHTPAFKIADIDSLTLRDIRVISGGPMVAGLPSGDITIVKKTSFLNLLQKIRGWLP